MSVAGQMRMPTSPQVVSNLQDLPFIYIQRNQDEYQVHGLAKCVLGHEIERQQGRPDGIYAAWDWDGRKLTARNDRYGFYPLFYFADARRICLSPVISRLIQQGADRTINDSAMAVFLRIGYFLAEDTPFRHIHHLPPGAELEWSADGLKVEGRLQIRRESSISRTAALEGYIELFRKAIERCPPTSDNYALPLSGGRDSRHIFLELCAQGRKPNHCVTIDVPHETDAEVAVRLTQAQGVPVQRLPATQPSVQNEIRRNLETSFCSDEHTWSLGLSDYLADVTACSYDGIAGDVLSASRFISPERQRCFEAGDFTKLANELISSNDRFTTASLPPELQTRWGTEIAAGRVETELKRYVEAANPMAAFIFWNRTRREIALFPYGLLRKIQRVYAPFLDHDLYEHLAALPARMLLDRKLHDDAMRIAYPCAAAIPYSSKTGKSPFTDKHLASLATGALASLLKAEQKTWTRTRYYAPRLIRARIQASMLGEAFPLGTRCLYLLQLEELWTNGVPDTGNMPLQPTAQVSGAPCSK